MRGVFKYARNWILIYHDLTLTVYISTDPQTQNFTLFRGYSLSSVLVDFYSLINKTYIVDTSLGPLDLFSYFRDLHISLFESSKN